MAGRERDGIRLKSLPGKYFDHRDYDVQIAE